MGYDRHDYVIMVNNKPHASFGMRGAEVVWANPRVMTLLGKKWPEVEAEMKKRGWSIAPARRGA